MRAAARRTVVAVAVLAATLLPAHAALASDFTDVPPTYWDYSQINYVAMTNTWMQDYGTKVFKPTISEARKYLARTLVTLYAPDEPIDPTITFPDLSADDEFYPYANVATKLGWIPPWASGNWAPDSVIKVEGFDKAIVMAMGLTDAITGLQNIHEADGDPYTPADSKFAYIEIAHALGLHYNHGDETMDLEKTTWITRDEAAYSLNRAMTMSAGTIDYDTSHFVDITLAKLKTSQVAKRKLTEYALDQIGFPYIWGGEWNKASPDGYCCGSQPKGGMDCSGFVWWTMKRNEGNYDAAQYHPDYAGWPLADRTSTNMAKNTTTKITWADLRVGDLMFFATNYGKTWSDVDHVGIWMGNDWVIHSTGSKDGPALEWIGDGYYYDIFVFGRRLIGGGWPEMPLGHDSPLGGDGPRAGGEKGAP